MKEWALRALLLVVSGALAILAAEFGLRIFAPQPTNVMRLRHDGVFSHVPNLDVVVYGIDSHARVTTNADGLRDIDRPRRKPPGVTRVLVLGDSMVEGLQVSLEETMPKQLEARLRAALPGRRIDVINAGVSGDSGPQELDYLEKDGLGYEPDLIIVAVTLRNDVHEAADTRVFPRPLLYDLRVWVRARSHLYGLLEKALNRSARARNALAHLGIVASASRIEQERQIKKGRILSREANLFDGRLDAVEARGYRRLFASYDRMLAIGRERGIPLLFVLLPSYFQATGFAAALGDPVLVPRVVRNDREPQDRVLAYFKKRGAQVIDLLPAARGHGESYFLPHDQHFTAAGHAFAAKLTAQAILARGMLTPAAPGRPRAGG